jgi:hypothetical protein
MIRQGNQKPLELSHEFHHNIGDYQLTVPSIVTAQPSFTNVQTYDELLVYFSAGRHDHVGTAYNATSEGTKDTRRQFINKYCPVIQELKAHEEAQRDETNDIIVGKGGAALIERQRTVLACFALMSSAETQRSRSSEDYFLGCFVSKALSDALRFSLRDEAIAARGVSEPPIGKKLLQAMATNRLSDASVQTSSLRVLAGYMPPVWQVRALKYLPHRTLH